MADARAVPHSVNADHAVLGCIACGIREDRAQERDEAGFRDRQGEVYRGRTGLLGQNAGVAKGGDRDSHLWSFVRAGDGVVKGHGAARSRRPVGGHGAHDHDTAFDCPCGGLNEVEQPAIAGRMRHSEHEKQKCLTRAIKRKTILDCATQILRT